MVKTYGLTHIARMLYSSDQNNLWDHAGKPVKFTVPTVANGKVYVGTNSELDVYVGTNPVWASGTSGNSGSLVVQNDGNAIIYRSDGIPIWATNTCCR